MHNDNTDKKLFNNMRIKCVLCYSDQNWGEGAASFVLKAQLNIAIQPPRKM